MRFIVITALLLASACGPASPPAAPARPTPTPSATATPTSVLAAEYMELVAPANRATGGVATALTQPGADKDSTRPAFEAYLKELVTFNTKLVGFQARVPSAAQADVQQLRQGVATEIGDVQTILATTAAADWQAAVLRWRTDAIAFGSAAQLVRADLGLPPATLVTPSPGG